MIVIVRADIFRWLGMVIWLMLVGGIVFEIRNPAKMLPTARRLIELTNIGLFSLIDGEKLYRGVARRTKNRIRVLYAAVRDVATRVRAKAQALTYDVVVASMIRSLE